MPFIPKILDQSDPFKNGMYGELLNGELLFVVSGVQIIFNCGHIYKIILLQIKQWIFWYMEHISVSSYTQVTNF